MKSHEDFIKNDSVEKYLLHQHTANEELEFEEHLLLCEICRNEVQQLARSVDFIKATAHKSGVFFKKDTSAPTRINFLNKYIRIAAAVIVLIAAAWFIFYYLNSGNYQNKMFAVKNERAIKPVLHDTTAKIGSTSENKVSSNNAIENYYVLSRFENLINNEYRSEGVDVKSPKIDQIYKPGEPAEFIWEKTGVKMLNLVIFDNKGKILMEQKIQKDFILKKTIQPGLYYWQLETEIETVFTGKFRIMVEK